MHDIKNITMQYLRTEVVSPTHPDAIVADEQAEVEAVIGPIPLSLTSCGLPAQSTSSKITNDGPPTPSLALLCYASITPPLPSLVPIRGSPPPFL